jgi:hypothetical protein
MDGMLVDPDDVDKALAELAVAIDENPFDKSMVDLIEHCVRCNAPFVYKKDNFTYACGMCDFEWEILSHV